MNPSSHCAGAICQADGVTFRVPAPDATAVHLCLFDRQDRETARVAMTREADGWWQADVTGIGEGQCYGYRADGLFEPSDNLLHDPAKLLADPWALRVDRPWRWHDDLATRTGLARETAHLVPKWVKVSPFVAMLLGLALSWLFYIKDTSLPRRLAEAQRPLYLFLLNKWYFDELYEWVFVRPAKWLASFLWKKGDGAVIDGSINGVAMGIVPMLTRLAGRAQSGYVFHYAFAMVIGIVVLVTWMMLSGGSH